MVFGIGKMIASTKEAFIKARDGQEETEQPTIDRHISRAMREAEWELMPKALDLLTRGAL